MGKVAFWNTQRLGANTDQARTAVLKQLMTDWHADLYIFCELMTGCVGPPRAQNLTYRKESTSQLCYGSLNANGDVVLTALTPLVTQAYQDAHYKGGNDFTQLADRAVAVGPVVDGVQVFAIHAPASNKAIKVMSFIAAHMDNVYGGNAPFLVVGDFNVSPQKLANSYVSFNIGTYIRNWGKATHVTQSTGAESELDYALCNIKATVRGRIYRRWKGYSDHSPILVEF